ncbi:MAG: hypothetical protein KAW14_07050 [Candidatus Aegiribacteria sp.]|nr:hypothetical protein [Candidatus Aegiribacteria sp.]
MKSIKGNYIWWAAVQLAAGILFVVLSIFWKVELHSIMMISILPLVAFNIWFYHGREDDEREKYLLLKVYSYSGSFVLVTLTCIFMGGKADRSLILHALWSFALISRGGFGLYYFIRE